MRINPAKITLSLLPVLFVASDFKQALFVLMVLLLALSLFGLFRPLIGSLFRLPMVLPINALCLLLFVSVAVLSAQACFPLLAQEASPFQWLTFISLSLVIGEKEQLKWAEAGKIALVSSFVLFFVCVLQNCFLGLSAVAFVGLGILLWVYGYCYE